MEQSSRSPRSARFGVFEVDLRAGELLKQGLKIRLQEKPFQVLASLLERPGDVVTREELRAKLWPEDTFVDFDHGINIAINKLREALCDSAKHPRYVETLGRHGYRFIAPVDDRVQASPAPTKIMLAVLPFENLSGDAEQEYFSDGVTEEMITQLGCLHPRRLGVIARTTAMHYKGTGQRIDRIGRELGVNYVLEGSVRRAADRARISVQLIQVSDQTHLWAETYERQIADVLEIQRDVAERVTRSLALELLPGAPAAGSRASTRNSAAYEAYLKGRYFWNRRTEEGFERAIECFDQAIQKDPGYALAYAGMADCYDTLGLYGALSPAEAYRRAKAAATKALEIDGQLAEAHTSLAYAKLLYDWDWAGAEREYKAALELNPTYATGHHWYGLFLAVMGRFEEAVTQMKLTLELDPLSLVLNSHLGWILYFARQFDRAVEQLLKTVEMDPNFPVARYFLGLAYVQKRMADQAIAHFRMADQLSGGHPAAVAGMVHAYRLAGKKAEARRSLEKLKELKKRRYVSSYYVAFAHSGLGEKDQAFEWLEKAYQERSGWLVHLKVEAGLDSLRSDPRYGDLLRRVGLPPYGEFGKS